MRIPGQIGVDRPGERKSQRLKTGTSFQQEVRQGNPGNSTHDHFSTRIDKRLKNLSKKTSLWPQKSRKTKDTVAKSARRKRATVVKTTTSSNENEGQPKKKPIKKRSQQVPEIAFAFEEEIRPPLVEISLTSTEEGEETEIGVKSKKMKK